MKGIVQVATATREMRSVRMRISAMSAGDGDVYIFCRFKRAVLDSKGDLATTERILGLKGGGLHLCKMENGCET